MDQLLEYEGLVGSIIQRYTRYFDKEDLYQVGMLGLINAWNNFDSNHNIKFSTYAYYYVLGEVRKFIRESGLIKVSKDLVKLNSCIEKAKDSMRQRLGREPSRSEISLFLEIDEEKIGQAEEAMLDIKSLDYCYDDNIELYNSVKCLETGMDVDILNLRSEIDKLSDAEKKLIVSRYYNDLTQTEASRELGISQVQVCRKEGKILEKLRGVLQT